MKITRFASGAMAIGIALTISAASRGEAQVDTTRRAVSEKRIPVRKDQGARIESGGEVALSAEVARINTLEETAAALRLRIESLETTAAGLTSHSEASDRLVNTLRDSLRLVRDDLAIARAELIRGAARTAALSDSVYRLNQRFISLRNGSLFGNSGFYVGIGTGLNFATGTLHSIGYREGMNVLVPIGWSKPGKLLGVRTEWGVQSFEGRMVPGFTNIDPVLYTATAMATLNLPINDAKTNLVYLMGGGGAFKFHRFGPSSALNNQLGNQPAGVTKWGLTGGAGAEFHILGATYFFVESSVTNVVGERSTVGTTNDSRNLRWVPLTAGITLR